jgi:type II secretory pathway component PulK
MTETNALSALSDKLKAASGPSKVLDAEIVRAVLAANTPSMPVTSSIDAAAALCASALPGWEPEIYFGLRPVVVLQPSANSRLHADRLVAQARAASVPLALCAAVIDAMIVARERAA